MVRVGQVEVGGGPMVFIGGPCVLETPETALRIAEGLAEITTKLGIGFIFKASFDKANRTRHDSYRGPGLREGLRILRRVKEQLGVAITTDVHLPAQAPLVAEVADLLQVPAFLCRQTDLVQACAATGRPVNLKKGQFMAPSAMAHGVDKARAAGRGGVLLTERGTSFGYGDLVVDLRGLVQMRALGVPVVYDMTHSVQRPGALGGASGGHRELALPLARGAVAVGVDAVFAEVHEDPGRALSDAALQLRLGDLDEVLRALWRL